VSVKDPVGTNGPNLTGTLNVLEAARGAGVKRVMYAASSAAYGDAPEMPKRETMLPAPISPYAVQKVAGEHYLASYARVYGLETVSLRYFNIFGPRQVPDSPYSGVMAKFILQLQRGERPVIFGDGEQGRDFTYVSNAVDANLLASDAPAERVAGRVFNVACGERHTLNETFRVIANIMNSDLEPEYGPERTGDVRDSLASIEAARDAFGYQPKIGFEDGLRKTVEWYEQQAQTA
jgi:nucleoside-diphosphate-sugar epimerase